jgi:high affinity Mn2+ porin
VPKIGDRAGQSRAQRIRSNAIAGASTLALTIAFARHPVHAADLVLPRPPVFTSVSPWEGFYAGGNVGYLFSGSSSYASDPSGVPSIGQTSVVGEEHIDYAHQLGPLSAGFQAGYNHVTASGLLLGVEADFSFPAILRSNLQQNITALGPSVVNDNVKIYGSLGGRVGYVFGDWLIYGETD